MMEEQGHEDLLLQRADQNYSICTYASVYFYACAAVNAFVRCEAGMCPATLISQDPIAGVISWIRFRSWLQARNALFIDV